MFNIKSRWKGQSYHTYIKLQKTLSGQGATKDEGGRVVFTLQINFPVSKKVIEFQARNFVSFISRWTNC